MPNARTDRPQPSIFKRYDLEERLVRLRDDSPVHGRDSLNLVHNPDLVLVTPNAGVGR
jgi:hypothetical protein